MILKTRAAKGSESDASRWTNDSSSGIDPLDRRDVHRGRQVIDDAVEQRLDAFVLERRSAKDGVIFCVMVAWRSAPSASSISIVFAGHPLLEELVVLFGDRLDHLFAKMLGLLAVLGRNLFHFVLRTEGLRR